MQNYVFLVLIMILFTVMASAEETHTIPIKLSRNKTLVSVKIGDVTIPDIMLDTGMPMDGVLIYNPDYQDSLDLNNAMEVNIAGAGSGNPSKAITVESAEFYLGNLLLKNQRIIMLKGDLYKGFPTNGIIGNSIFGNYLTEIDYDNNTMTLTDNYNLKPDSSFSVTPLYFKDNNVPWLDAYVAIADEKPVELSMYIDYAMEDTIVLLEKPKMKFIVPENTEKRYLGTGLSGDIHGKRGKISKLIVCSYEMNYVTAAFAQAEVRSKQDNADAILGGGALHKFNLIFNYVNKKLYLKPNTHFND